MVLPRRKFRWEVARKRGQLEKRLTRLQQWAKSARRSQEQLKERHTRLHGKFDLLCQKLSCEVGWYQTVPPLWSGTDPLVRQEIEERNAKLDTLLGPMRDKLRQLEEQCQQDLERQERYCKAQREVLRALEDLSTKERTMYELDNRKDQVMSVCKVAMANLAMWVRDQYFPPSYAHATWLSLLPFFQLPGTVTCNATTIQVQLSPFNDRSLNRDLVQVSASGSTRLHLTSPMDGCFLSPSAPLVAFFLRKKRFKLRDSLMIHLKLLMKIL